MESHYWLQLLENYWEARILSFVAFICQQNELYFQDKNGFYGLKMADSITKVIFNTEFRASI